MRLWLLCALCLILGGCSSRGDATAEHYEIDNVCGEGDALVQTQQGRMTIPPGGRARVSSSTGRQPNPGKSAATASAYDEGADASSGDAPEPSGLASSWVYLILGSGIFIFGGLVWLAKRKGAALVGGSAGGALAMVASKLPAGSGPLIMATGAAVAILPWFLQSYGWMIGLAAASVIVILLAKWILNLRKAP